MRIKLEDVNTNKLHDELIKANIVPSLVESLDNSTWITIEDDQENAVMEVVSKHNPIPIPPKPSLEEKNRADIDYIAIMTGVDL